MPIQQFFSYIIARTS